MNRSGLAATSKRLGETTRTSSTSNLGATFNAFLFATVCEERNEMPLSVISVLARLDLDPWAEAAELAKMPTDSAARRLSSLLDRIVKDPPTASACETAAARLVALLPTPATTKAASRVSSAALLTATQQRTARIVWLVFLASIVASLMMGSLAPRAGSLTPTPTPAASAGR